ncbi:MAG: DNA repair exonuclease [Acidimicrobiales bacterium]|nr:DNA repair exonuclease [Acidimicrobiales bacterium]
MPFTFLHAADLHLDTPFADVSGFPEHVGDALREASLQAWTALVDEASRRRVGFVVLAGDIYDGAVRGLRAQRAFLEGVSRLADEGIRTLLVHGNHDPVAEGWTAVRAFPDLVTTFPAHGVATEAFEVGDEQVFVHGTSYAVAATSENLAQRYPVASGGGFHVGLLHANVGGASTGHADYSPCTLDDLRRTGYQYWALGHVHGRRVLCDGEPWVVYPGNLQGRSTKPTEQGAKGAVVVAVDNGVATEPELVALDRVRFVDLDLSIAPYSELGSLLDQLEALADPHAHQGRSLVVRANLTGAGPLHEQLLAPARRAEVLDELRRRGSERHPFVWWQSVAWRTRATVEVVDLHQRDDFAADLLRTCEAADARARGSWNEALPADLLRELGDLLPDGSDDTIWAAAQAAAFEAISGAGT